MTKAFPRISAAPTGLAGLVAEEHDTSSQLGAEVGDVVRRLVCMLVSPAPPKPNRLLNAQEVADLLNTNAQVVYRLARNQELQAVNLGERMLRFTELSVSEFINRGGVSRAA